MLQDEIALGGGAGDLVELAIVLVEAAGAVADEHEVAGLQVGDSRGLAESDFVRAGGAAVGGERVLVGDPVAPTDMAVGREHEPLDELRSGGEHGVARPGADEANVVAVDAPAVGGGDVATSRDADGAAFGWKFVEGALERRFVGAPVERSDERVVALEVAKILVLLRRDPLAHRVRLAVADGAEGAEVELGGLRTVGGGRQTVDGGRRGRGTRRWFSRRSGADDGEGECKE